MRRFQNFDKRKQHYFNEMFPDIEKVVAVEETDAYTYMAISVFDHWLGEEDSIKFLSDISKKEQENRDHKFYLFSKKLLENTEVINFTFKGRRVKSRPVFREFSSKEIKEQYLLKVPHNVCSNEFFQVALPQLEALYLESWDDTNVLYLRNTQHADVIESWANECGLYRLDKW